ncbi:hypothetical protein Bca4012_044763 [Brassica carinata]
MKQGDYSVREYNTKFLAGGLLDIHGEGTLVKMYREGLREDIQSKIGKTVFSTLDEIMQEALDVDEGGRPCDRSVSPTESDDSVSDDSVYAHSGKHPKKKARTEKHRSDDVEDEEHDGLFLACFHSLRSDLSDLHSLHSDLSGLRKVLL